MFKLLAGEYVTLSTYSSVVCFVYVCCPPPATQRDPQNIISFSPYVCLT